jgi:hypothetical protein
MSTLPCMTRALRCMVALTLLQGAVHAQDDWVSSTHSYLCKSSTEVREVRSYWRGQSEAPAKNAVANAAAKASARASATASATASTDASASAAAGALSCRVDYLKAGTTQTLWSAHHGRAYCDDKAAALVSKLTAAGEFRCERLNVGEARR